MVKSLYIHIPFCRSRCVYCDFYSTLYEKNAAVSFVELLNKQLAGLNFDFETIYIGGGTPSVFEWSLLRKLFVKLKRFKRQVKEFTIEVNPESLSEDKLKLFIDSGINRISIGCQSFDDRKLKFLERIHSAKQALISPEKARRAGFENISIDLIFGLPDEPDRVWREDLAKAGKSCATHLSAYSLSYERGTQLWQRLKNKEFLKLNDTKVARMYKQLLKQSSKGNFYQYEISNFAKKGFKCIHNCRYWENEPYIGLGPSGVSYSGKARRKNISSLAKYKAAVEENKKFWDYSEKLSDIERAKETAALKIRTIEGISLVWFKQKTGFDFDYLLKEPLGELTGQNLIAYRDKKKRVVLTSKGVLFADTVSAAFL